MAKFDLSGQNISDSFQHLLQVRDTDSTLFDGSGNPLDNFNVSGSFTTSETLTSNNLNSQFLTFEKSKTISTNQTFSGDNVSLMLGDDLTVGNGASLTIEDDAQFIVVPSSFFIQ
mgnify:FL=1|tara:strand:- start:405 stop:749 length:345 start_codon:yes stop_codon:yes gene_type:complete